MITKKLQAVEVNMFGGGRNSPYSGDAEDRDYTRLFCEAGQRNASKTDSAAIL